jgi:hypothetical protein
VYQPGLDLCRDRGEAFTEDAELAPRPGLLAAEARRLRIVIVSEVRFLREGLAEFLERCESGERASRTLSFREPCTKCSSAMHNCLGFFW